MACEAVTAVLRVGASVTAAVPAAIVRLRKRLPGAAVQLVEGRVHELIHRLLEGNSTASSAPSTPELIASDMIPLLEPVVLLKDELCVLASAANRSDRRATLEMGRLAGCAVGGSAQGNAGPASASSRPS